jgi:predicted RNA-binding Zn-ribbon protein involved in translation (DUF1610 family)
VRAVIDCPNCGEQVERDALVCPNCGFDIHSSQADDVRRLREDGRIHPGRLGEEERANFSGRDPHDPDLDTQLPAEDLGPAREDPRERDAGM